MAIPFDHPLDVEIRGARGTAAAMTVRAPAPPEPRRTARQYRRQPGAEATQQRKARLARQSAISGYKTAANYDTDRVRFPINRSGGFFKFIIKDGSWGKIWAKIARATESGKLGHFSSIPTPRKNREYAKARGTNPLWYPIFVHTHDKCDREHRERILTKIINFGIPPGDIEYRTSQQTDSIRQRR